jgi:hypothetical protein
MCWKRGMRHTSTALYFYGASKKEPTQAPGHFWEYCISDKLWLKLLSKIFMFTVSI